MKLASSSSATSSYSTVSGGETQSDQYVKGLLPQMVAVVIIW